jgi:hypothetical protein
MSKRGTLGVFGTDTLDWVGPRRGPDGRHETATTSVLPGNCPFCGVRALVELPPWEFAKQTDGTNVVCAPPFGGCNHGFEAKLPRSRKAPVSR